MRTGNWKVPRLSGSMVGVFSLAILLAAPARAQKWDDPLNRATIRNEALEASFQSGILVQLKDLARNKVLVSIDPAAIPDKLAIFGPAAIEIASCTVKQTATETSVEATLSAAGGNEWTISWSIEPGRGDLIAQLSAHTAQPVQELRLLLFGCDMSDHSLVWVDGNGVGRSQHAPWEGTLVGNPMKDGSPGGYIHPLVALFQGEGAGWWIEGRDQRIGPSAMMVKGMAKSATIGFARRFAMPTTTPELYEVRIRAYRDRWEDAVDPYLNWMETGAGFVPLEKQQPAWVRKIKTQAYIRIGDFKTLENLAKEVDPDRTFLGRMVGAWIHPMDIGYPDYTLTETATKWIKRARELGFHVGLHFNTFGISKDRTDLLERFREGLLVTGKDEKGNDLYQAVDGPHRHVYCSPALKAWRQYLIQQIKPAIDAGIDVVYLDESMAAMGTPVIDGMTSIDGVMAEEKEIKQAYPHVAIETEQFNLMNARHASFALSQMPLGHPLSGYIYHRYINVVAEGVMGQPTDSRMIDAFAAWGFMLPCANGQEDSWLKIAQAFQKYDLKPDPRLARHEFKRFDEHPSHGLMPQDDAAASAESRKLFGYRGTGGVTAWFEKAGNRRGLVVYESGKKPRWIGTRIGGVSQWPGPGVLRDFVPGAEVMVDWLIYTGNTQLALDPQRTYALDESGTLPQDRFHVTAIPKDFAFYSNSVKRIESQYAGPKNAWFKINYSGHGEMALSVPDKFLVYLDGREVSVDRGSKSARIDVDASPEKPSTLLAFEPSLTVLSGRWIDLPWHAPPAQRSWYFVQHVIDDMSTDGPVRMIKPGNGFWSHIGGSAMMLGTFPSAKKIRLQGAFAMREESQNLPGDGVVRINGKEVLRVPGGPRPYQVYSFDADVTSFAGKPAFLEFTCEGDVNGPAAADWFNPQIIVDP